jgi:hypothetical protein
MGICRKVEGQEHSEATIAEGINRAVAEQRLGALDKFLTEANQLTCNGPFNIYSQLTPAAQTQIKDVPYVGETGKPGIPEHLEIVDLKHS